MEASFRLCARLGGRSGPAGKRFGLRRVCPRDARKSRGEKQRRRADSGNRESTLHLAIRVCNLDTRNGYFPESPGPPTSTAFNSAEDMRMKMKIMCLSDR